MAWQSAQFTVSVLLFSLGAGAWFAYFRLKEDAAPFSPRLLAMVGGAISVAAALAGYDGASALGLEVEWSALEQRSWGALEAALAIGFIEESAKLLPVLLIALATRRLARPAEGLVFAALAGIGFATAESTTLLMTGGLSPAQGLARAVAAPVTHALFAAPWGLGLGRFLLDGRRRSLIGGLCLSAAAHGLYDLLLAQSAGGTNLGAAAVVLALWGWTLLQLVSFHPAAGGVPVPVLLRRAPGPGARSNATW